MARQKHTLPAGTFKVTMYAYCGMSYEVGTGEYSEAQARDIVKRFAQKRERAGYSIAQLGTPDWQEVEIGEPEDASMVPDDAGVLRVTEETVPAWECFGCGDLVPHGEACHCRETAYEHEAEEMIEA
jgi:hypothetical protein